MLHRPAHFIPDFIRYTICRTMMYLVKILIFYNLEEYIILINFCQSYSILNSHDNQKTTLIDDFLFLPYSIKVGQIPIIFFNMTGVTYILLYYNME